MPAGSGTLLCGKEVRALRRCMLLKSLEEFEVQLDVFAEGVYLAGAGPLGR